MINKYNLLWMAIVAFNLIACEGRSGNNNSTPANGSKAAPSAVPLNPNLEAQRRVIADLDKEGSPDTSWHPLRLDYFTAQLSSLEELDQKIETENLAPEQAADRVHRKYFISTMRHRIDLIREIQKEHADYGDPTLLPNLFAAIEKKGKDCAELGSYLGDLDFVVDNQTACYDQQLAPILDQAEKAAVAQSDATAVQRIEVYRRRITDFKVQAKQYKDRLEADRRAREIYHY